MTGLWMLTAAVCAAEAMWLKQWRPVRVPADLAPAGRVRELPMPLVLEMLSVAIRQGSSIPRALIAVGDIAAGEFGAGLRSAGEQLNKGVSWDDAWPDDGDLVVVRDAFASSWHSGPLQWNVWKQPSNNWIGMSARRSNRLQRNCRFVCCYRPDCAFFPHLLRLESFRPSCRLCNDGVCATTTEKRGMLGDDNSRSFVDKCG